MTPPRTPVAALLISLLFHACTSVALRDTTPVDQFDRFVDSYFSGRYKFTLEADSANLFPHLHRTADSVRAAGATAALKDLRSIDTSFLDLDRRIDWLLLEASFKRAIRDTVLREYQRVPGRYLTIGGLYWQIAGGRNPSRSEWITILKDLHNAPSALKLGMEQIADPPPLWVRLASATAARYRQLLRGEFADRVTTSAPDSFKASLVDAVDTLASLLDRFIAFLSSVNPAPDDGWRVGEEHYTWLLREVHFLPYNAQELIAEGRRVHEETKQALADLARRIDPAKSWKQLVEEMKTRHPPAGGIAEAYRRESDRARALIMNKGMIAIPEPETLLFVPTPPPLRETYAWGGYGGIEVRDSVPHGRFFVTDIVPGMSTADIEQKLRAQNDGWITVIALHEGYPGHHLQSLYTRNHPSRVRVRFGSSYFGEGWALYCEAWMAREGFYENADDSLAWLQMRLWRTARVMIDPSLHLGMMSYEEAVRFFMDEVGLERSSAEAEVNRYTTWPTQAPSYVIGWLEIERLHERLRNMLGAALSDRAFAEALLNTGSLPPALLKRALFHRFLSQ
ncbi:MAG: hypothetical protein HBSIN02_08130 [Bacteroidia bacterium]|nr:MAG: hypothetical protein HBSIN02_08130 [Bacteroidia bacterium]